MSLGGWLHGVPDEKGEMSGQDMMYLSPDQYCASLAHKVNHSFRQNSEFVRFHHPRFGLRCLAIRTFQPIMEGEEIFINYRDDPDSAPAWYSGLIET